MESVKNKDVVLSLNVGTSESPQWEEIVLSASEGWPVSGGGGKVNVAPTSTEGHFVEKAKNVVNLDNVTESFFVEGSSVLTSKNHTTLPMVEDCLVSCQAVYNPFSQMMERSKD